MTYRCNGLTYAGPSGVFGIDLQTSVRYAKVAITLTDPDDGRKYVYGYVPIVIATCGAYLKERGEIGLEITELTIYHELGVDTPELFMRQVSTETLDALQKIFDSPPRYGEGTIFLYILFTRLRTSSSATWHRCQIH
jgi:hypothetical protein